MKRIIFSETARADVRRLDRNIAMRIFTSLHQFDRHWGGAYMPSFGMCAAAGYDLCMPRQHHYYGL